MPPFKFVGSAVRTVEVEELPGNGPRNGPYKKHP